MAVAILATMLLSPAPAFAVGPSVTTNEATTVGAHRATLRASVNPGGLSTTYRFEYGTTTAYGQSVPVSAKAIGSGGATLAVSEQLSNLEPSTIYHFRVVATNSGGTSQGVDRTLKTTRVGAPTFAFSFGIGGEPVMSVVDFAVDAEDNIYASDAKNRIQKFNANGELLSTFGSTGEYGTAGEKIKGEGFGKFWSPSGIAIDASGNIYVADTGNHRIQKFNSKGEYLSQFGSYGSGEGNLKSPSHLELTPSGDLLVVDKGNERIEKFDVEGNFLEQFKPLAWSGPGEFLGIGGIAFDDENFLHVVDVGSNRIQKLGPNWEYISQVGTTSHGDNIGDGEFTSPLDLAFDSEGYMYVADYTNNRIQKFNPSGEYVTQFGMQWGEFGGGAGQIRLPSRVAVNSKDEIYVAEWLSNKRVSVWQNRPTPESFGLSAVGVKEKEATLNATIDPKSRETTYQFEYGTTSAYGTTVPMSPSAIGSGSSGVKVSQELTTLTGNTTYHFRVTATNASGTAYSEDATFQTGTVPQNSTPPATSSSTPLQAVPISTSNGTWTGVPTPTYTYQWRRCNSGGGECVNIANGKNSTYTPVSNDVGYTLVSAVTASNSAGAQTAYSAATATVKPIGQVTEYSLPSGEARGIDAGPDGNLWFANWSAEKIGKITTSGTITQYSLASGTKPWGITAGPDGNLWYTVNSTNGSSDRVGKITTSGSKTEYALGWESGPRGITVGPDGNLWYCSSKSNKIGKITTAGSKTEYSISGARPTEITAGPDGNLWFVTEIGNTVGKITTSGSVTEYALPEFSQPVAITAGPDGNLWFTNSGTSKIGKITTAGTITEYTLWQPTQPYGITTGPDGKLWFTEGMRSKIGSLSTAGTKLDYFLSTEGGSSKLTVGPDQYIWFTRGNGKIGKMVP